MEIIILLVFISLSIAILFLVIFFWNVRSGQYDDTYTPSIRMLFDEPEKKPKKYHSKKSKPSQRRSL